MNATIVIVLLLGAVVGAVLFLWLRSRPVVEEPLFHFNCPHCQRRLRYRRRQAGHQGACPRCRQTLHFPVNPEKASPGH
jgi:hypothetical protein